MDLEFEKILTVIVTILGLISPIVTFLTFRYSTHDKLRKEYEFSKEFLKHLDTEDLHLFSKEKGYQAIAGTTAIGTSTVKHILTLESPVSAMSQFKRASHLLYKKEFDGRVEWTFKFFRRRVWFRKSEKVIYILGYVTCSLLAISPLILKNFFQQPIDLKFLILTFPFFGFFAFICVYHFVILKSAEKFLEQKVLVKPCDN